MHEKILFSYPLIEETLISPYKISSPPYSVEPPTPSHHDIFLHEKIQEIEFQEPLPELSITDDAEKILNEKPKIKRLIMKIYAKITTLLHNKGIIFFAKLIPLKYSTDEETEILTIKIEVVDDIPYQEILKLWDELSQTAHENLPPEISDRISVILDKAKRTA